METASPSSRFDYDTVRAGMLDSKSTFIDDSTKPLQQFELHRSHVVDLRKCPDVPIRSDESYQFAPSDLIPPVYVIRAIPLRPLCYSKMSCSSALIYVLHTRLAIDLLY
jgi:hypothetical protein